LKDEYAHYKMNANFGKDKAKSLQKKWAKFEKLAKELGINPEGTETGKLIDKAFDFADQTNDTLMNMKDAIKSI